MPTQLEGDLLPRDAAIAIVVARFNDLITNQLLEGAVEMHQRLGGNPDRLTVARVPGSMELPIAALTLARSNKYAAVICLGCVVRGATGHYDHVAGQAAAGIARASIDSGVPVIFGVITADTLEQAFERAGTKQGNAGAKAMTAAIEMANLMKQL